MSHPLASDSQPVLSDSSSYLSSRIRASSHSSALSAHRWSLQASLGSDLAPPVDASTRREFTDIFLRTIPNGNVDLQLAYERPVRRALLHAKHDLPRLELHRTVHRAIGSIPLLLLFIRELGRGKWHKNVHAQLLGAIRREGFDVSMRMSDNSTIFHPLTVLACKCADRKSDYYEFLVSMIELLLQQPSFDPTLLDGFTVPLAVWSRSTHAERIGEWHHRLSVLEILLTPGKILNRSTLLPLIAPQPRMHSIYLAAGATLSIAPLMYWITWGDAAALLQYFLRLPVDLLDRIPFEPSSWSILTTTASWQVTCHPHSVAAKFVLELIRTVRRAQVSVGRSSSSASSSCNSSSPTAVSATSPLLIGAASAEGEYFFGRNKTSEHCKIPSSFELVFRPALERDEEDEVGCEWNLRKFIGFGWDEDVWGPYSLHGCISSSSSSGSGPLVVNFVKVFRDVFPYSRFPTLVVFTGTVTQFEKQKMTWQGNWRSIGEKTTQPGQFVYQIQPRCKNNEEPNQDDAIHNSCFISSSAPEDRQVPVLTRDQLYGWLSSYLNNFSSKFPTLSLLYPSRTKSPPDHESSHLDSPSTTRDRVWKDPNLLFQAKNIDLASRLADVLATDRSQHIHLWELQHNETLAELLFSMRRAELLKLEPVESALFRLFDLVEAKKLHTDVLAPCLLRFQRQRADEATQETAKGHPQDRKCNPDAVSSDVTLPSNFLDRLGAFLLRIQSPNENDQWRMSVNRPPLKRKEREAISMLDQPTLERLLKTPWEFHLPHIAAVVDFLRPMDRVAELDPYLKLTITRGIAFLFLNQLHMWMFHWWSQTHWCREGFVGWPLELYRLYDCLDPSVQERHKFNNSHSPGYYPSRAQLARLCKVIEVHAQEPMGRMILAVTNLPNDLIRHHILVYFLIPPDGDFGIHANGDGGTNGTRTTNTDQ